MAATHDFRFKLVHISTYSPGLVSSDFHLFPNMEKSLTGIYFVSDDDDMSALEDSGRVFQHQQECVKFKADSIKNMELHLC